MRNVLFLETANDFNDHSAARLVVAAEHGRFVGADDIAFDDRFDAFAGNDRVHMRAHHDRRSVRNGAGKARDYIAAVAADRTAGVVNLNLRAHFFAVFPEALGDVALLARVTIDLHKFEQQVLDAFLVDH